MTESTLLLKEHHLKATPQRIKIISMIEEHGHITIEDLYKEMLEQFPSVSLATIYKNINQMAQSGLIQEIKIPKAKSVFELIKEPHLHIVCDSCGKIEDIPVETENIIKEAEKLSGYRINESFVTLRGTCPECR